MNIKAFEEINNLSVVPVVFSLPLKGCIVNAAGAEASSGHYYRHKLDDSLMLDIEVRDADGALITVLANADIAFEIKMRPTDTSPLISKTQNSGIEVDTPSTGMLRITMPPSDFAGLTTGFRIWGCQIIIDSTTRQELALYDSDGQLIEGIYLAQDVVND